MPLALAAASLGLVLARSAAFGQFLSGGGRNRLAIALNDQHLAIALGQRTGTQPDLSRSSQPQNPPLDRRGGRCPAQEHAAQFAGQTETQTRGQPTEPT